MEKALSTLQGGKPARILRRELSPEGIRILEGLTLLTAKPVLYVANVAEADAATGNTHSEQVAAMAEEQGAGFVMISAAIEAEIAQLPEVNSLLKAGVAFTHRPSSQTSV
jgi:ribosome-binding ATPase YchF (GTP1/OBG family)